MTKRFYIVDTMEGDVRCTDDETYAMSMSVSEDCFVIDTKLNQWVTDGEGAEVRCINA